MLEIALWISLGIVIRTIVEMIIESRITVYGKFIINSKDLNQEVYSITLGKSIIPGRTKYINLKIESDMDDSQE